MKKVLGIILSTFLTLNIFGAAALAETGSIQGDGRLFAPPEGVKSQVQYSLLNAGSEPVSDAIYSITKHSGVSVNAATGVVTLDGTSITSGAFTITAASGSVQASKTITIPDARIFSDFEDETAGAQAMLYTEKLDGTKTTSNLNNRNTAKIAEESSGNKYASPADYLLLNPDWAGVDANHKTVTLSYRTKVTSNGDKAFKENSDSSVLLRSSAYVLTARCGTDAGYTATSGTFKPNGWTDMKIVCDYYDRLFSVYLDDELIIDRQPMRNVENPTGFFKKFYVESAIDDFAMYSGSEVHTIKYDFEDNAPGEAPAYIDGNAVVKSENGNNYLDAMSKSAAFSTEALNGEISVTATLKADDYCTIRIFDKDNRNTTRFKPESTEWQKLTIVFDNFNLTVICGNKLIKQKGVNNIKHITKIEFCNTLLDNLKLGKQDIPPNIINPLAIISGSGIMLDYIYFAPQGETEGATTVKWYYADSKYGEFSFLGEGKTISKIDEDKYIKFSVSCTNVNNGNLIWGEAKKVSELDMLIYDMNNYVYGGTNAAINRGVDFGAAPIRDWTAYDKLVFRFYSERSTGRAFDVVINSENTDNAILDYYYTYLVTDWGGGYKDIEIRIGEASGMEGAGVPLGWDQITSLVFWSSLSTPQKEEGTLLDDNMTKLIIGKVFLRKEKSADLWDEEYILDADLREGMIDYSETISGAQHPRLLTTQAGLAELKQNIAKDSYRLKSYNKLYDNVEKSVAAAPLTEASSATAYKMAEAALLYNLTLDPRYSGWVWQCVNNLTKNAESWNPGSASFLAVGDTARAMALTYDWMYNYWSEEQRLQVRNAIMRNAIEPVLPFLRPCKKWAGSGRGNWNQAILSGVGMSVLAICDSDDYSDIVNEVLNEVIHSLGYGMRDIEENGAYPEGVSYWSYAMDTFLAFDAAMIKLCGDDGGLMESSGMSETGYYPIMMTGPGGTFNFSDATANSSVQTSGFFWLSEYFDNPSFAGYHISNTKTRGGDFLALLLYSYDERYENYTRYMPLYKYYEGTTEAFIIRRDWDDNTSAYLGFKGGNNKNNHAQLDIGSFVYDINGVRWISELGRDSYTYDKYADGKWVLYRNRAEGNNCIVINPNGRPDQDTDAYCKIEKYRVADEKGYGIIDMTNAYDSRGVTSARRGFAMLNDYKALLIQDEIKSVSPVDMYSFMHTTAAIEISADKKSAVLTKSGQKLRATLLSSGNAIFKAMPAEPLPGSPNPPEAFSNADYRKLAVYVSGEVSPTISVLLTPFDDSFTQNEITPLDHWNSYFGKAWAALEELQVNGTSIASPYDIDGAVETMDVRARVFNPTSKPCDVYLIAACYKNGIMEDLRLESHSVDENSDRLLELNYRGDISPGAEIKFMIWNRESLEPILNDAVIVRRKS